MAATGLLDTGPEPEFDSLAQVAANVTGWRVPARVRPISERFCYFLVGLAGERFTVQDAAVDQRTRITRRSAR